MRPHPWLIVVLVGALAGVVFAGLSTYDFVQHLDRQVHSLHCSFVPGAGTEAGASGCQVAMMSEYSSVLRARVWGGIPISLPAMAVFAFLGLFALELLIARRKDDPRATAFLALAAGLPAAASLVMLIISLAKLGTTCTLCVSIYVASAACLAGAIGLWRRAVRLRAGGGGAAVAAPAKPAKRRVKEPQPDEPAFTAAGAAAAAARDSSPSVAVPEVREVREVRGAVPGASNGYLAAAFGVGVAFVLLPVLVYLAKAPDHGRFIGTCDGLAKPDDTYGIMVRMDRASGGVPSIEILDPLCPACAAFERRLAASGYGDRLERKAVLFPLDDTCNWMVTEATHPGACTVSEAVLCAGDRAPDVLAWAFEEGERIRAAAKGDPAAAARLVRERFPDLGTCVGSPEAKSRLNKSLRWAVANNIRVLTPQLYVANVKLCDEDVDLGLEYSLRVMLERHAAKTLAKVPAEAPLPPPATPQEPPPPSPSDKPSDKPRKADKPVDKPAADKPADKPAADKPADKPAADKPADKPAADKPADKPAADKPADKPAADQPATPTDKPITSPSEAPARPITSPSEAPAGGTP